MSQKGQGETTMNYREYCYLNEENFNSIEPKLTAFIDVQNKGKEYVRDTYELQLSLYGLSGKQMAELTLTLHELACRLFTYDRKLSYLYEDLMKDSEQYARTYLLKSELEKYKKIVR